MTFSSETHYSRSCHPSLGERLAKSYGIWRQRQALKRLDSAALHDIGVTRAQAEVEAGRSVWDAPESWYC